jgi:hypothetical protein
MIAVVVSGPKNLTRISGAVPHSQKALDTFAALVAAKEPGRHYYVAAVDEQTWGTRRKELMYSWHVGEGFTHDQGWWVDYR